MSANKKGSVTERTLGTAKSTAPAKSLAASVRTQRATSEVYNVTAKSEQSIDRNVALHRDALKRLADR